MGEFGSQKSTIFVSSPRFYISHWCTSDRQPFSGMVREPRVMRYIGRGETWHTAQVEQFIARQQANFANLTYGLGPIKLHKNDQFIGMAGLQPLGNTEQVEIGCWLLPQFWGHNRADEIGEALLRHGFINLGLTEIWALARQQNRASIALMNRLGFRYHATLWGWQLGLEARDVETLVYKNVYSEHGSINETV
ncbi:MAG TPA: hypothetical protein DCZ03_12620 [Gammaproteobacteria bacterium]|nr:hypothetical protein [Gammaproteobacteria bacterium]